MAARIPKGLRSDSKRIAGPSNPGLSRGGSNERAMVVARRRIPPSSTAIVTRPVLDVVKMDKPINIETARRQQNKEKKTQLKIKAEGKQIADRVTGGGGGKPIAGLIEAAKPQQVPDIRNVYYDSTPHFSLQPGLPPSVGTDGSKAIVPAAKFSEVLQERRTKKPKERQIEEVATPSAGVEVVRGGTVMPAERKSRKSVKDVSVDERYRTEKEKANQNRRRQDYLNAVRMVEKMDL